MGKLKFRIVKLTRSLPPSWADLERLFWQVSERPSQTELNAFNANAKKMATPEQQNLVEAFYDRNCPRAWVAFDTVYPLWSECPDLKNHEIQSTDWGVINNYVIAAHFMRARLVTRPLPACIFKPAIPARQQGKYLI